MMEPRTGLPLPFAVEAGKVREFARAVRSPLPESVDGAGQPIIAPTYPIVTMFLAGPEHSVRDDGRDIARILHAEQEFVFHGPPPAAGTMLYAQQRQGPIYAKQGRRGGNMTFVEIDTTFRDDSEREVMRARFITVTVERPDSGRASG